ncbi:MAG: hypothetical protein JW925_12600 [Syntrophaceae bacterium]|nr:hypothetical protein [Syntrophaceae bacterium]
MRDRDLYVHRVFNAVAIDADGNTTSGAIDLRDYKPIGNFAVQVKTTSAGAAVVKLEYLLSIDGVTYVTPTGADDIVTAHAVGSQYYDFAPETACFLKIKATETGSVAVTALTVDLVVQ